MWGVGDLTDRLIALQGLTLLRSDFMSVASKDIASKILSVKGGICYKFLKQFDEAEKCFREGTILSGSSNSLLGSY